MKTAKIEVSLRASDSIYWHTKQPNGHKNPEAYTESLRDQGFNEFARCPEDDFKPDLHKLGAKNIQKVARLLSNLDESQVRLFTWLLANQDSLIQQGLAFGQRVYVNLSAPYADYLDCYFAGYVLSYEGLFEGVQYFNVCGSLNPSSSPIILLPRKAILTEKQFLKKQAKLSAAGKLKNPKKTKFKAPPRDSISFALEDVPTIDDVKDDMQDTPKSATLKKKKAKKSESSKKFIITD